MPGAFMRRRIPKTAGDYLDSPDRSPQVRGRAVDGYADVAPMPPAWGSTVPRGFTPEARNAPAFADFPDYANTTMGLRTAPLPTQGAGGAPARLEPPDAPPPVRSLATMENQDWNDAVTRARQGIAQEGVPYAEDQGWLQDQSEMLRALEQERAARAEQERREQVSFEEWWRYGGRQAGPSNDAPAYRFTRVPPQRQQDTWATSRRR